MLEENKKFELGINQEPNEGLEEEEPLTDENSYYMNQFLDQDHFEGKSFFLRKRDGKNAFF